MKKLKYALHRLLNPKQWLMLHHYSDGFDVWLNRVIDEDQPFTDIDRLNATIGGKTLWIENHPYASFTWRGMRPSAWTIMRAQKHLESFLYTPSPTK